MANTDEPVKPDDPTVDLSQQTPATQPVLQDILERVNAVAEALASFRQESRENFARLEAEVKAIRGDMRDHHRQLSKLQAAH